MSERKNIAGNLFKALFFILLGAVLIRFVAESPIRSFRILIAIVGFGTCIIVHEFGHFIVAKLSGIKCHTFSIGFPPTFLGIKRTERGIRFRLLPGIFTKSVEGTEEKEARLSLTLYKPGKEADTEYCLGLIPFGGFVGMLGQEDASVEEASDDPASFTNKPISTRMGVISAGVIFNLIAAIAIFTTLFMIGIKQTPAIVGSVVEGMPAAEAGLVAGDEIIEINGKKNPNFSNLFEAAALSGRGEKVPMTVRHTNGVEEEFEIAAKMNPGLPLRQFGIVKAMSLKIALVDEPEALEEEIGLRSADEVFAVNKTEVAASWEYDAAVANTLKPYLILTAKRFDPESEETKNIETELPLEMICSDSGIPDSEKDLKHIHSIVPRLKINIVTAGPLPMSKKDALLEKISPLLKKIGLSKFVPVPLVLDPALEAGDIIVKVGDVANPTFYELRAVTAEHADVPMAMTVLRFGGDGRRKAVDVEVVPRTPPGQEHPIIGIAVVLDADNPIVAKTIENDEDILVLDIPRGAMITSVDGVSVANYYDIITVIDHNPGQHLSLEYEYVESGEIVRGAVAVNVPQDFGNITVKSQLADFVPFDDLLIKKKADNFFQAVVLGGRRMVSLVAQSYITLKGLILGDVKANNLMGPLGIADLSYRMIKLKMFTYYLGFIGMINCFLAVMNFLPIPIVDGGLFVMMIVEKLTGKQISIKAQEIITYIGLVLLGTLFIYVTFNDALRLLLPGMGI